MKTTRYRFEQSVQEANASNLEWLKEEYKSILQSNKDYTRKADYIGFSIISIDTKMQSLDDEIKELQHLKKNLKLAKEVALKVGAEVFSEFGIDKLEGAGISSITINKPKVSSKNKLIVHKEEPLIQAGFYKKVIDTDTILEAYKNGEYIDLINKFCSIETINYPTKLKINKRRINSNLKEQLLGLAS
ncbi:siphovirus Gp157 family protein [Sulfurospirillum sp. 1307]